MRALAVLFLIIGCSSTQQAADPPQEPVPEPAAQPSYEVHEWGLINVGHEGAELAAGPGQPAIVQDLGLQGYGKPVLYFHLAEDSPNIDVQVDVSLRSFGLGEHFPAATVDGNQLSWQGQLRRERCATARVYPVRTSDACTGTPDGYCEAAELSDYETAEHSCFHIGDAGWPLLFYRGTPSETPPSLPIEFSIDAEGNASARRTRAGETIGKLWYMVDHEVRAVVDWPANGESVVLTGEAPANPRDLLHTDLLAHGLNEAEAQAFGRAWNEELFGAESTSQHGGTIGIVGTGRGGGGTGEGRIGLGNTGTGGLLAAPHPPPVHRVVYWLPEADHESMAELTFEPAPSAVRRATLVRVQAHAPQ